MDSDYVAWNGERYVWPPPEGWYLASDGRWWAPDTGPDIDLDTLPAEAQAGTDLDAGHHAPIGDGTDDTGSSMAHVSEAETSSLPAQHDPTSATPDLFSDAAPSQDLDPAPGPAAELDATAAYQISSADYAVPTTPTGGRPVTGQVAAIPDGDTATAMASSLDDGRRNPTMVMAEPRTSTGPHQAVSVDPDTGRHDRVPVLEPTEAAPSAGIQRSRTMPMVAAGLLAAAAIGIAALLALLGGDSETQTQQPSASAEETEAEAGSDGLVVSTDGSGTPTSADGAMGDGSMDDGAMDDAMSDDDAMTEDGQGDQDATSTTTAGTVDGTGDAALIGEFRTLLEDNQITAAALTGDDLTVFGDTACSYATSATDLAGYTQVRDEALNGAQNDELSTEELRFVVDAAVTVFCPDDATRLGLTATAPVEG